MTIMAQKQGQEAGYMDGVCVKISEKYKPPPRIGLAITYSQRLLLNKQIQEHLLVPRDCSLESSVMERISELKDARRLMCDERKARAERIKERRLKFDEEQKGKQLEAEEKEKELHGVNDAAKDNGQTSEALTAPEITATLQTPTYSNILTPIPLKATIAPNNCNSMVDDKSPFNISDFEEDTSSPFDNMELKTLNDIEELAQVLKKDDGPYNVPYSTSNYSQMPTVSLHSNYMGTGTGTGAPFSSYSMSPNYSQAITTSYSNVNGYYYPHESRQYTPYSYNNVHYNSPVSSSTHEDNTSTESLRSIPDIMKSLQHQLASAHIHNTSKIESPVVHSKSISGTPQINHEIKSELNAQPPELDDPFNFLPKHLQDLTRSISSMGFPLSRVARACQQIGDDKKKIVEHLLAMSQLLDLGFSEKQVLNALAQSDSDRDKALDLLIS